MLRRALIFPSPPALLGRGGSDPRRGAAIVEAAILLPFVCLLALGCVDFGRCLYHHIALANAVRAGGAHAIMNSFLAADEDGWKEAVQDAADDD